MKRNLGKNDQHIPRSKSNPRSAITVAGSGQQTRDTTMKNPKPTIAIYKQPAPIPMEGRHPISQENRNQSSTTNPEKKEVGKNNL